jgi:hypothetical protein
MSEIQKKIVMKNPCSMWKENKEITILFENAGEQTFLCLYDEKKEKYFYCEKAQHSYHSRLFNKKMKVIEKEIVYTAEEMRMKALNKYFDAEQKRNQALGVLQATTQPIQQQTKEHKLLED